MLQPQALPNSEFLEGENPQLSMSDFWVRGLTDVGFYLLDQFVVVSLHESFLGHVVDNSTAKPVAQHIDASSNAIPKGTPASIEQARNRNLQKPVHS